MKYDPNFDASRRAFMGQGFAGLGTVALTSLFGQNTQAGANQESAFSGRRNPQSKEVVNPLHHPAKAKRVIFLYQAGGPSHLEVFDYKPQLAKMHSQPMPESFTKGQQIAQLQNQRLTCYGPQTTFKKFGQSGQEVCELFPHLGSIADEVCIIRSMWGEQINHDPAHLLLNTGSIIT